MELKCFLDSCKELPDVFCKCNGDSEPICQKHISAHFSSNPNKIHNPIPAFKSLNPDLQESAIEYFQSIIKENNEKKKIIIEETQKFLKLSNELLNHFEELNNFIFVNLIQSIKNNRVLLTLDDEIDLKTSKNLFISDIGELHRSIDKTIK